MDTGEKRYLVDDGLVVSRSISLVQEREKRWLHSDRWVGDSRYTAHGGNSEPPIPISPDGTLATGVLYDSSSEPFVKYYLPRYQLRTVNGRYTTTLKFRSATDDPNGPLGWLTVELTPQIPPAGNFTLREIDHEAVVLLSYQMPVQGGNTPVPPVADGTTIDQFVGNWANVDLNTNGMTRLEIAKVNDTTLSFHGYGKCSPTDCDWGIIQVPFTPGKVVGTYQFGFKTTQITIQRSQDHLTAVTFDHYTDNSGRTDRTSTYILKTPGGGVANAPRLRIELGALQHSAPGVRSCRRPILLKEEFDRIYQIMTDSKLNGQLDIRCLATIGHRTWQQIVVRPINVGAQISALAEKQLLFTDMLNAQTLRAMRPDVMGNSEMFVNIIQDSQIGVATPSARVLPPDTPSTTVNHPRNGGGLRDAPETSSPSRSVSTPKPTSSPPLERLHAVPLEQALSGSDLTVKTDTGQLRVIPVRAVVDATGRPAILRVPVEADQVISPFSFPIETNANMFDLPGDIRPTTNHVLIKETVISGDITGTFYRDSAFRDQVYYQPTEFRLPRNSAFPYNPDLVVAFWDVVGSNTGGGYSMSYRVTLNFRALPYIDPQLLAQARVQLADAQTTPHFAALDPVESALLLAQPGQPQTEVARSQAKVSFNEGVIDSVDLSSVEFEQVFARFREPDGVGLTGHVRARLFDGNTATIPVTLSLSKAAGTLFDRIFEGPVAGSQGQYQIKLRNHIESKVHIDTLYGLQIAPGVTARPVGTAAGLVVNPGDSVVLTYQVTPVNAAVTDIEPVLATSIETNHAALWRSIMINQGYTTDTFTVSVSIDSQFFAVPATGIEPLISVLVEFEADISVTLTPSHLAQDAVLRMPLLPRLMKEPEAQKYRYRVTNMHASGMGARTNWKLAEGALVVTPAPLPEA